MANPQKMTLKTGDELRNRRSSEPPIRSTLTKRVAAAVGAGFRFIAKKAFLDATEMDEDGGSKREVTWAFKDSRVTFRPIRETETIGFDEYFERIADIPWCEANPDHPIAHVAATIIQLQNLEEKLRGNPEFGKPLIRHLCIRKGLRKKLYVPMDTPQEEIDRLLRKFKMK